MDVVVTVGSDHHPFDRLVRWVDQWAARNPEASVWVQHGRSQAPEVAQGIDFSPHDEVLERMARADAVVTAGGPGTLMEIRAAGLRPIVVPRRGSLEEHVDGHQRAFARRVGEQGLATTCERAEELWAELDAARSDP
ncbi:MAG TPA: glycosyltransferase, partial [Acidimicrobiales bacterium]